MNTSRHPGLAAYRETHAGAAHGAGPHEVVLLLFDGALARLAAAQGHIERGEVAAKAECLSRALAIVESLRLALDHARGGDIARNLEDLYEYVTVRIAEANLRNDAAPLRESTTLLNEVRSAWAAIEPDAVPA